MLPGRMDSVIVNDCCHLQPSHEDAPVWGFHAYLLFSAFLRTFSRDGLAPDITQITAAVLEDLI